MKRICLTTLVFLALAVTAVADDYIVILLDTSGSTGDYMRTARMSRLDVAKKSLTDVLSKIPDTTKVGLLTFRGWVRDLQPINRNELTSQIQSMQPGGDTPLFQYMMAAADRLLKEREKQGNVGSYKLLVITDGEANGPNGRDPLLNKDGTFPNGAFKPGVLKDIISRNITVDVIGLAMQEDHSLKTQINGSYMRGDDPASMTQAVNKAVAEVGFGATKDASDEAFAEIKDLPEPFILGVLKGITTFANHPIGEQPPVKVVQPDGTVQYQPAPIPAPVAKESHWLAWIIGSCIVMLVVIVGAALLARWSDNY